MNAPPNGRPTASAVPRGSKGGAGLLPASLQNPILSGESNGGSSKSSHSELKGTNFKQGGKSDRLIGGKGSCRHRLSPRVNA